MPVIGVIDLAEASMAVLGALRSDVLPYLNFEGLDVGEGPWFPIARVILVTGLLSPDLAWTKTQGQETLVRCDKGRTMSYHMGDTKIITYWLSTGLKRLKVFADVVHFPRAPIRTSESKTQT